MFEDNPNVVQKLPVMQLHQWNFAEFWTTEKVFTLLIAGQFRSDGNPCFEIWPRAEHARLRTPCNVCNVHLIIPQEYSYYEIGEIYEKGTWHLGFNIFGYPRTDNHILIKRGKFNEFHEFEMDRHRKTCLPKV